MKNKKANKFFIKTGIIDIEVSLNVPVLEKNTRCVRIGEWDTRLCKSGKMSWVVIPDYGVARRNKLGLNYFFIDSSFLSETEIC